MKQILNILRFIFFILGIIFLLKMLGIIKIGNLSFIQNNNNDTEIKNFYLDYLTIIFTIYVTVMEAFRLKKSTDLEKEFENLKTKNENEIKKYFLEIEKKQTNYKSSIDPYINQILLSDKSLGIIKKDETMLPNLYFIQKRESYLLSNLSKGFLIPEEKIVIKEKNKPIFFSIALKLEKSLPEIVRLYALSVLLKYSDEDLGQQTIDEIKTQCLNDKNSILYTIANDRFKTKKQTQ